LLGGGGQLVVIQAGFGARHDRHARLLHSLPRSLLVAHAGDGVRCGANEDDAFVGSGLREIGPFGEEAVTGVNSVRPRLLSGFDHLVNHEVAFAGRTGANREGLVRVAHVQRAAVYVRVDGHAVQAEFAAGANHPDGDFTPVGDQDLADAGGLFSLFCHNLNNSPDDVA
jgi:hypothetical protein